MGYGKAQGGRVEDIRLLTGRGRYVDDIAPPGALHVHFLRSQVAHADIRALDLTAARAAPGVHLVLAAGDLLAAGVDLDMKATTTRNRDGSRGAAPLRPLLATGRVRFVGEALAVVVADTPDAARDAAELIEPDLAERPVHLALAPGGEPLHPAAAPDNCAFRWELGDAAAVDAAIAAAAHVVRLRVEDNRIIANAMEPRAAFADWEDGRIHLCVNGQGVWNIRTRVAAHLGMDPADLRVTTPDVGGGFGMKATNYPEYPVLAHIARLLRRPVRWMADRTESMLSDNGGRDLVSEAVLAFDAARRITAYRVDIACNLGAYNSQNGQIIQADISSKVLTGVYDIPAAHAVARGYYTNTTQVDAYRGAGRPEAIYTLERAMDEAARQMGTDPFALREANFIRTFPYRTPSGETYDVGDFPRVLARLRAEADVAGFPARRAASAGRGRLRGMGLAYYVEAILGDPTEGATVVFNADGTVDLLVGTQSNGQGHETVYARFLSEQTGIPMAAIRVVQGDSDRIAKGGGTGGSRSVTTQTNATLAAVTAMVAAFTPFLAGELGAEPAFAEGAFRAPGSNRTLTLLEAADLARARGRTDLLRHAAEAKLAGRSYPNGAHLAEVEVDPETGQVELVAYAVADDLGNLLDPQLVAGQIHGGIAQGAGQALCEHVVHDAHGQLLTATFMDYAMPRAADFPRFRLASVPVPTRTNPLGMKGCGEAGTVGALPAVANAVRDALAPAGVARVDMPFTPARVWAWLKEAGHDPSA
ncbi:xanthine dehydrogenase family protein molybdopterin-binding subunit [Ruixingdingia sedimenti]|uniref:Xanthine dehydrogenase family protein molybdopterin-binding subunit n=1 Tax=Ruixingdingia sedimenti TaxID=3073604 RepID=A0ABU1FCF8_9RHOB|nr:xanthine dehydrogenase family protein molybdopterin-binding subunit [Xinfangfangia sp. LG-4]MDR5654536.1 xanthine dehydrogenase family protein molybdopterin-binding subunit [Xinfangfangia sp. LG-4]